LAREGGKTGTRGLSLEPRRKLPSLREKRAKGGGRGGSHFDDPPRPQAGGGQSYQIKSRKKLGGVQGKGGLRLHIEERGIGERKGESDEKREFIRRPPNRSRKWRKS